MKGKFIINTLVGMLILLNVAICSETVFGGNKDNQGNLWQKVAESKIRSRGRRSLFPKKSETFSLNQGLLADAMSEMPLEFSASAGDKRVIIDIPMPDGELVRFRIEGTEVLAEHLAAAFPSWKTFQGYGIDDPTMRAQFDWTNFGFHEANKSCQRNDCFQCRNGCIYLYAQRYICGYGYVYV